MDLQHFLYALLLLLVGQIPLVIKLVLDRRAKAEPYKRHLYERQASTFLEVYVSLAKIHTSLHNLLLLFPEPPEGEHKEFHSSIVKSLLESITSYSDALERSELLLPADLALHCAHCKSLQHNLLAAAMGVRPLSREDLWEQWEQLSNHYNIAVNLMRLCMGVDKVSEELFRLLSTGKQRGLVNTLSLKDSYRTLLEREHLVATKEPHNPAAEPDGYAAG